MELMPLKKKKNRGCTQERPCKDVTRKRALIRNLIMLAPQFQPSSLRTVRNKCLFLSQLIPSLLILLIPNLWYSVVVAQTD